jgi:hypothetical protein
LLKVRLVVVPRFQMVAPDAASVPTVHVPDPIVSVRVVEPEAANRVTVTLWLLALKIPAVTVRIDVLKGATFKSSRRRKVPPGPFMVKAAKRSPFDVMSVMPEVAVKVNSDVTPNGLYDAGSLSAVVPAVFMVMVTPVLCVIVPAKAYASNRWTATLVFKTTAPEPEFASKIAVSDTPGTEALFAPPLVADQLVLAVALKLVEEPPPTQKRSAI